MSIPGFTKTQGMVDIPNILEDEDSLLEYEAAFQALADFYPQLMWMAKADGWIYWYNRHWYTFTGATAKAMEGWGWQSVHHPDELPKVLSRWQASIDTGEPFEMTFPLRGADGGFRLFLTRVVPVKDTNGQVLRWFGANTDITEQAEVEKALRYSEKQLSDFFDTASIGLHWVGPDGIILRANQAELDLLGYTAEEYIGRNISEFHADTPVVEDILTRLCNNEKLINYEARLRCKDGTVRDVLINSSVYWEDGEFIHTRCFTRDITDIKATESAQKESELRFRTMAEDSDILIAVADETGRVVYFNKAWTDLTGKRLEELIVLGWADLLHPDDRDDYMNLFLTSFEKKISFQGEFRILNKEGEYRWLLAKVPARFRPDGSFAGYISSCVDITESKLAEVALKDSLSREQLTRRVAALSNQGLELDQILQILAKELGEFFQTDRAFILHLERSSENKFHISTYAQYCRDKIRPYDPTGMSSRLQELYQRNQSLESMTTTIRVSSPEEYRHYCRNYLKPHNLSTSEQEAYCQEMVSLNFEREGMRALLRLPVVYRGIPYGNIVLHQCQSDRVWTDEEIDTLQEIATQIGTVFYQTEIAQAEKKAKDDLQKSFEREHLIRKIVEVIGQSFEIDLILSTIADELGKNLEADRCGVSRFYFEDDKMIFVASGQYCAPGIRPVDQEDIALVTKAVQHLTPKDIKADQEQVTNISDPDAYIEFLEKQMAPYNLPGLPTEKLVEIVRKYEAKSTLRVNIRYRGVPYGSITLSQVRHNREWLPEEVELVKIIAEHAGSAIYQTELYRHAQETAAKEQNARQELELYAKRLEASNNELEQFATIASHDLQEPLRKIQVFSEMLTGMVPDEGQDYLRRMANAAERMRTLMDDLLTLSRINRKGKPFGKVDLNKVVKNVLDDIQVAIQESGATVSVEPLANVHADESQIHQLVQNLVSNAIKYRREDVKPIIRIYGQRKGHQYETIVEDNGIGLDKEHFTRIFEPFQRLHGIGKYPGTGMGLAIVKKIAERHNGHLTVESEPGKGSQFSFTLSVSGR